jgi:beta-glucosidase
MTPDRSRDASSRAANDDAIAKRHLALMTLEEKATLLTGASAWTTTAMPRLGLPSLRMADGPHGVRRTHSTGSMAFDAQAATCFPTASSTAATWDPGLLREMGEAIAREAIALEVDVVLGPGVNMKRSPLCGRNFEYFSEDPHLAGQLAVGWIEGIQSLGVGASLKHFAINNQETRRMSVSAEVDERALREIYLPAFERAVTAARPWTVMCAYNRINGVYASEHRELLTDVLRSEWGFDGFVVSDWAAVHDRPRAVAAGTDLEMPGPRPRRVRSVIDSVLAGALDEKDVDEAALRVLRIIARASASPKGGSFNATAHHDLARRIAAEGMVLLKNDGVLPLSAGGRIAVVGRAAKEPRIQGGGSSQITPTQVDIPIDELTRLAGATSISYSEGYDDGAAERPDLVAAAAAAATDSDIAIVFVAMPVTKESEGVDRVDLALEPQQVALIQAVCAAQPRTVVVLFSGSAVTMAPWIDGAAAVLEAWYSGQAAGGAVADILFGVVNPSGRLAETFPLRLEDTPAYLNFPGDGDRVGYGEGLYIGYRWYEARDLPVAFPFGHGMSYTTFRYDDARTSATNVADVDGVTVTVDVTNTGGRTGSEVVQVYVRDVDASVQRPEKELRGFAKVRLEPGETRAVDVRLDSRAFAFWDPRRHGWVTEAGAFEILVGSSSAAIHAVMPVTVVESAPLPSTLSDMSPLQDWLGDAAGRPGALALVRSLAPILGGVFGQAVTDPDDLDPHFHSYFSAMPIRDLLEFAAPAGGPEPEASLDELLASLEAAAPAERTDSSALTGSRKG